MRGCSIVEGTRLRNLPFVAVLVTIATLAAGVPVVQAAPACPQNAVLIPLGSTSSGSETEGTCIRSSQGPTGGTRVDGRYSDAATAVITRYATLRGIDAREAVVVCWSRRDWRLLERKNQRRFPGRWSLGNVGFVMPGMNVVNLAPDTCRELDRITYRGGRPTLADSAFHIGTLAHESLHVAGVENEAKTECLAMQLTAHATVLLGLDQRFGREGAKQAYREYSSYGKQNPGYYTSQCHNGTPLDLRPGTLLFP